MISGARCSSKYLKSFRQIFSARLWRTTLTSKRAQGHAPYVLQRKSSTTVTCLFQLTILYNMKISLLQRHQSAVEAIR